MAKLGQAVNQLIRFFSRQLARITFVLRVSPAVDAGIGTSPCHLPGNHKWGLVEIGMNHTPVMVLTFPGSLGG